MKKLLIFLFLIPLSLFSQSVSFFSQPEEIIHLDSINYYFGILLNNERDSINNYHKDDSSFQQLNFVTVETDESKFVNPQKHVNQIIDALHDCKSFSPHTTTNKENMLFSIFWSPDGTSKEKAKHIFNVWKKSEGHYAFMIQDESYFDGTAYEGTKWFKKEGDYKTFKILFNVSYDESRKYHKVFVSTFTAWD